MIEPQTNTGKLLDALMVNEGRACEAMVACWPKENTIGAFCDEYSVVVNGGGRVGESLADDTIEVFGVVYGAMCRMCPKQPSCPYVDQQG